MRKLRCPLCHQRLADGHWWPDADGWFGTCMNLECDAYQSTVQAKGKPHIPSDLEAAILWHVKRVELPDPMCEFWFHPSRDWQVDFVWRPQRLVVEAEGAVWQVGRHNHPQGFLDDLEKYNALTLFGYRLLRFTSANVTDDPNAMIEMVRQCLGTGKSSLRYRIHPGTALTPFPVS